jgi:crotonobetainyl-CoA:carnitine CoA-transferase CaiB-like acyl-CoA transferase
MIRSETPASPWGNASRLPGPLQDVRICDLSGQLAGAGATRVLAAFGAQVIRIEDPVRKGMWDIVRQIGPRIHHDLGPEGGSGFNNHNVEKLGITLNLRTERGKELLAELVRVSQAVTENFAAGVMDRLGFGYERLRELRPDIVYVSNSGFGHAGPYHSFKSWGPIAQAMSGLTHTSGLPGLEPAGWGYSYMDHSGAYTMAIALLAALYHQRRTGEGQWVDIACAEAGIALAGLAALDASVNGRDERAVPVDSSRSPAMAPHGIYPCRDEDTWVAIAVRDDDDWTALVTVIGAPWASDPRFADLAGRLAGLDELDRLVGEWTHTQERDAVVAAVRSMDVPGAPVLRPYERCDDNPDNEAWGLWPTAVHSQHGPIRVDGLPVHLSAGDWRIERGGPLLGEDNERVFGEVLGLSSKEVGQLAEEGVI